MINVLRSLRPDLSLARLDPCSTVTRSPLCGDPSSELSSNNVVQQHLQLSRCSSSSSSSTSSSPCPTAADHFAPMLSTLNMSPKVLLTRTPVTATKPSLPKKKTNSRGAKSIPTTTDGLLTPYVLLEKIDKIYPGMERTIKNLKGLDMLQVTSIINSYLIFFH